MLFTEEIKRKQKPFNGFICSLPRIREKADSQVESIRRYISCFLYIHIYFPKQKMWQSAFNSIINLNLHSRMQTINYNIVRLYLFCICP